MIQARRPIPLRLITLVASLGGGLFGFDMAVISGVLPLMQRQFSLSAAGEGWLVSSALVGCIAGVALCGELSDRLGRKALLLLSAALFLLSALGCLVLPTLPWIIAARLVGGIGIGIASSVVPLYLSEIAPAAVRGRVVTGYQLALTLGILTAYLSNAALLQYAGGAEVWRVMLGLGALPALLFLIGVWVVPESPRWLLLRGRVQAATEVIRRITVKGRPVDPFAEASTPAEAPVTGTYRALLAPGLRKALLIGLLLPLFSQFSGINAIIYYGPTILHQAGLPLESSLKSQVFFGVANMLFTGVALWKVDHWGRRPLYLWGTAGATIALAGTGFCFFYGATASAGMLVGVLAFLACFAFSIGPLKFVVASEIFPGAVRGRAMAVSIMVMWVADTLVGQLTPVLLDAVGPAGTFWFFAFFCAVAFFTIYRLLPETKGKSLEQIEQYWSKKAPAGEGVTGTSRAAPVTP